MKSYYIAGGAIFGALAAVIRLMGLKIPFILIPYLKFELAEVPVLIGLLLYGPTVGIIAAMCYWGILNAVGEFVPIGPAMALAASLPTVVGMWAGLKAFRKFVKSWIALLSLAVLVGAAFRVIAMTALNYLVIWTLFPSFFKFASSAISSTLGISFGSELEALVAILFLTAIFNILQTLLIAIPSLAIVRAVEGRIAMGMVITPWITRVLGRRPQPRA